MNILNVKNFVTLHGGELSITVHALQFDYTVRLKYSV